MIDPQTGPIDVDEQKAWLASHMAEKGLQWPQIASLSGIARGTISSWAGKSYGGNSENVAREVLKYRQMVESQAARSVGKAVEPKFVETKTAERIISLLVEAQAGKMTLVGTGPGTSKTSAAKYYAKRASNVWLVTCNPATKTMSAVLAETLRKVGGQPRQGWVRGLAAEVINRIEDRRGLIIYDEANHLDFEAIEMIRSLHDETKVGICLMGNEELIRTIFSSKLSHAHARTKSRISRTLLQDLPLREDVETYLDAWGVTDGAQRTTLIKVAMAPRSGGLREVRQILDSAAALASLDERSIELGDLRDSIESRNQTFVRASA